MFLILAQKYPHEVVFVKNTQIRHLVLNLGSFVFSRNFPVTQILGCWFQIWQYCFQIPAPKYPSQAIFVTNLRIFIFCTKLSIKADSKALIANMTMFFQNCCPKYPNNIFLFPNLGIIIFTRNFVIRQIGGRWLQMWQLLFNFPDQKPK